MTARRYCSLCVAGSVWLAASAVANQPPVISDLAISPSNPQAGATVHVTCTATDLEAQDLVYIWTTAEGTLAGADDLDAEVDWTLPAGGGNRRLSVQVIDTLGGTARADRLVPVGPLYEYGGFGQALRQPVRAALGANDDLWVTDAARARVVHLAIDGTPLDEFSTAPRPLGLAILDASTLLVGEDSLDRVSRYSMSGAFLGTLGSTPILMPNAIAVAPSGQIHVADSQAGLVRTYASNGAEGFTYGAAELQFPVDLCISPDGNEIFVGDQGTAQITVFDSSGTFLRTIGTRGASPGQFVRIQGVALDDAGQILVLDAFQSHVQVISSDGTHIATFGHLGDWRGAMRTPLGLAVSPGEQVFVTSSGDGEIEVFANWLWSAPIRMGVLLR